MKKEIIYVYFKKPTYPKPVSFPYFCFTFSRKNIKIESIFTFSEFKEKRNFKYFFFFLCRCQTVKDRIWFVTIRIRVPPNMEHVFIFQETDTTESMELSYQEVKMSGGKNQVEDFNLIEDISLWVWSKIFDIMKKIFLNRN